MLKIIQLSSKLFLYWIPSICHGIEGRKRYLYYQRMIAFLLPDLSLPGFLYPFLLIPIVAKTSQRRCLCCTKTCNLYELPSVHFSSKRRLWLSWRNTITKGCTHPGWGHCIQPFLRTGIAAENTGLKSSETMPWTRGPQAAPQNNLRHIAHKKPPELAVQ